jgi:hypothetical protein
LYVLIELEIFALLILLDYKVGDGSYGQLGEKVASRTSPQLVYQPAGGPVPVTLETSSSSTAVVAIYMCPDGYVGDSECNVPICFGKSAQQTGVCGGYGTCVSPDQCVSICLLIW